jgi:tRNA modification GTPase
MVTNLRHREALLSARADLESAEDSLKQGLSSELLAVDLRGALHHLGEIIGEIDTEDILSAIFSKFCIGK